MKQRSTFKIKMPHLLVAAIDFGTTYSGCAFSFYDEFKKDPTKSFVKNWIDPNSSMMYCKTSTCILFNEEKEFNEFGFAAEAKYLDLMLENDHHNWYFFRRFKMVLYDIQSEDQEILIEDEHGNTMPALTVFSESLKYLKQSLLDYVNASVIISMDDIKWVITVPAIWSDPAKTFMRRAAIQAEIDSDMLTIALEPEAAALFVKYLPVERKVDGNDKEVLQAFAAGSKYIVVDAGGGTVDITAHEVLEDGHVKELIKSTGGSWGGTKVDEEYMDFLKRLIGDDTTKYIDENLPSLLFEARRDFESAKHIIKPNSDKKINVRFPAKIAEIYTTLHPDRDLRAKDIVLTKNKKQMAVLFKGDKLRLATKDVEDFFTQSVKNISDHLAKLLQENDGKGISTIILVGGYAESQMLVQGIKAMFPEINTIIPKEAAWSVLRGAVIFGHDPSMISQRRSKYTYGIQMNDTKRKDYQIVGAIDFGTTFSGYAFSTRHDFLKDPRNLGNISIKHWVDPISSMMYYKTPTCILFTEEKIFDKFGFEAEAKYLDLILDNDHENWYFFRRFKMSLYAIQSEVQDTLVEDETGKTMSARKVFSESLRFLVNSLFYEVRKQQTDIEMTDIRWVVTVPAIWSEPAKAFMRKTTVEAGIDSSMLTIALEPEAAALHVKLLPVERRICENENEDFETFAPGSNYIVVDVGGGTVDITAHEVLEDGRVKELIKATGGNWGGTKVDEEYMDFIKRLIGEDTAKYIEENIPSVFFEACREFEMAKRAIKPNSDGKFNVRIPSQIGETYSLVHCGRELKSVKTVFTKYEKHMDVSFTGDKLRLKSKDAEDFFAESITKIADFLSKLIQENGGNDITTIILVGGYAESAMLIEGIKSKFSHMRVIIPTEAAWSILKGAVIFGHSPNLIKHRRSQYTYGIGVNKKFKPSEHDEKHKYEENGEFRCWGLFSKLVEIDEIVSVGEHRKIDRHFHIKNCKEEGNFKLYASTLNSPKYVDEEDCFFIGHILSPGHEFLPKHIIYIDVYFGKTQIMFIAQQPNSAKMVACYLGD